jgi:hypothetical protein
LNHHHRPTLHIAVAPRKVRALIRSIFLTFARQDTALIPTFSAGGNDPPLFHVMASNGLNTPPSHQYQITDDYVIDYDGGLDHAPATSHGTYLDGSNEGLEPLEDYQEGGYHPVHIGDSLGPSDRYRIIQKLGHGGFGTVWLCRDLVDARYVALKVMASNLNSDKVLDFTLAELDHSIPGSKYIAVPLGRFTVQGPNGTHQCLVLPPLGPCVSPDLWMRLEKDPGMALRKFAHQTTQALDFLHKNQICHGGELVLWVGNDAMFNY